MSLSQAMLPEFDHEMATTRKVLERVPDAKFDWKPHDKSFSLGDLASHLANITGWTGVTLGTDAFDVTTLSPEEANPRGKDRAEVLAMFDKGVAGARAALAGASDETMMGNWSLMANGVASFTLPRVAVLRSFVMNHAIHHRGALGVYLRMLDVPLPSVYGPSADEGQM